MNAHIRQHVIDPEICIRCHTCEEACPIGAISHDDNNVVVDPARCNACMSCIAPCPTGSIDHWRVVATPYSLGEQLGWTELPVQADLPAAPAVDTAEPLDDEAAALFAQAHAGAGGLARAPASASLPSMQLFSAAKPAVALVQGNYRLTGEAADSDIRHIILDLGALHFPVLEGQSVGVIAPGLDAKGRPHRMRLYSVSSPRDGERPGTNNLSLTVKRDEHGMCSNYLCDLKRGERVHLTGPYGATFLMPNDAAAHLVMVCTGTGSAPFRGFTMQRQRTVQGASGGMTLFFGARTPDSLPYFGPLAKVPDSLLVKHFAFSRVEGKPRHYVQQKMLEQRATLARLLALDTTCIYICGLKAMEAGVEQAFAEIAGPDWPTLRQNMREAGRCHVETY